jgi:hypothetical protein
MTISLNRSVLSEIEGDRPIPLEARRYFRRLLQNRIHELVLQAFMQQEEREGLNQKQLAGRLQKAPEVINRWLHTAGNWELDTLADLLLGMKVRLNELSYKSFEDLERESTIRNQPQNPLSDVLIPSPASGMEPIATKLVLDRRQKSGPAKAPSFDVPQGESAGQPSAADLSHMVETSI